MRLRKRDAQDATYSHQLHGSGGSHEAAVLDGRFLPLHPAAADAATHLDADAATGACVTTLSVTPAMICLLYTSPSPRDQRGSRMPSSA